MSRTLPCGGFKTWTDYGYEYDCIYSGDCSCDDCVCTGGEYDPRYLEQAQPKKLSKFIIRTRDEARELYKNNPNDLQWVIDDLFGEETRE